MINFRAQVSTSLPTPEVGSKPPKNCVLPRSHRWVTHVPKKQENHPRLYAPTTSWGEYYFNR